MRGGNRPRRSRSGQERPLLILIGREGKKDERQSMLAWLRLLFYEEISLNLKSCLHPGTVPLRLGATWDLWPLAAETAKEPKRCQPYAILKGPGNNNLKSLQVAFTKSECGFFRAFPCSLAPDLRPLS